MVVTPKATDSWDDFEPAPPAPHAMPAIPCGIYQVSEPGGSIIPIRVRRRHTFDYWEIAWLIGSDGLTWEPFGKITERSMYLNKQFRTGDYAEVANRLFMHFTDGELFEGWDFVLEKPACAKCGRGLKKKPEIKAGIHDTCAKNWLLGDKIG